MLINVDLNNSILLLGYKVKFIRTATLRKPNKCLQVITSEPSVTQTPVMRYMSRVMRYVYLARQGNVSTSHCQQKTDSASSVKAL